MIIAYKTSNIESIYIMGDEDKSDDKNSYFYDCEKVNKILSCEEYIIKNIIE